MVSIFSPGKHIIVRKITRVCVTKELKGKMFRVLGLRPNIEWQWSEHDDQDNKKKKYKKKRFEAKFKVMRGNAFIWRKQIKSRRKHNNTSYDHG